MARPRLTLNLGRLSWAKLPIAALCGSVILVLVSWLAMLQPTHAQGSIIRVGYFPNVTHAQALVARNFERHGRDWFAPRLGAGVKVEWHAHNAGPSALQAVLSNSLDLTYAGPSSVIGAYVQLHGQDIRIVAGAVNGGSALVVQPRSNLAKPDDFRGKRIATPEFGNTQDVAARAWLTAGGLLITKNGGDAEVLPTPNPYQLALLALMQIDAVWTVEPWVSRLELLADGKVLIEEKNTITTLLVSSTRFLTSKPDLARRFVAAHRELTEWIHNNPVEAQRMITEELLASFNTKLSAVLLTNAWGRIKVTNDVSLMALQTFLERAKQAGFIQAVPSLSP